MDVHRLRYIAGCRTELDRQHQFVDDFGPLFTDDVRAEQFIGLGIGDEFHEALRFAERPRLPLLGKVLPADTNLVTFVTGLLLGQPDVPDLGVSEYSPGHGSVLGADILIFREKPVEEVSVITG